MATVRYIGFWKFKFFNCRNGWERHSASLYQFRKDRSDRSGDITIFMIFKVVSAAILDFQKYEILAVDPL